MDIDCLNTKNSEVESQRRLKKDAPSFPISSGDLLSQSTKIQKDSNSIKNFKEANDVEQMQLQQVSMDQEESSDKGGESG